MIFDTQSHWSLKNLRREDINRFLLRKAKEECIYTKKEGKHAYFKFTFSLQIIFRKNNNFDF